MANRIELSEPLSVPFAEIGRDIGANFSPSVIGVAGRAYLLDTESGEWRREGINVVEQRNTTSNRDLLLLPQGVWRYMFESWHEGAGQSNLDRDEALHSRFYQSYGVDPWDRFHVKLLNNTTRLSGLARPGANQRIFLFTLSGNLVVAAGSSVFIWDDSTNAAITHALGGSIIISATSDGERVITLDDAGKVTAVLQDGTHTDLGTFAGAHLVAYQKDYLLIGQVENGAAVLKNITDPAKPVIVYTSPVPGFKWTAATEGSRAIYLSGGVGDRYVIHRVGVKDDGTGLNPAIVASQLPDGELAVALGSYLGFVFIGTDKGVRMAIPDGGGDLTLGALLPTSKPVYGFEGQDRFVWYTNSAVDGRFGEGQEGFPTDPVPGLGRMDLTTFTTTEATPAYANDLVVEHPRVSRRTVWAVATWKDRRIFAIDGEGVFMENPDELMPAGWVTHGAISFGVEDPKTSLYAQFKWTPLRGTVGMWAAYDSARYTRLAEKDVPDSIRSGNVTMDGQQFSRINIGLVLRRDKNDPHQGPVVTRWEFRAIPVKGVASRWYLPILNRAELEFTTGVVEHRNPREELLRLMALVQRGGMFPLVESGVTYSVTPRDFQWKPDSLDPTGRSWQGTYLLVVEEIV